MGDIFVEMVKKVGIFIIVGQTLLHFGVGKRYEKYYKLIISLMVVSLLVSGFGAFIQSGKELGIRKAFTSGKEEYYESWKQYTKRFEEKVLSGQKEIEQRLEKEVLEKKEENDEKSNQIEKKGTQENVFFIQIDPVTIQ